MRQPRLRHTRVGGDGCSAFVDKHDGAVEPTGELVAKVTHELGAWALGVIHVQRDPEHEFGLRAAGVVVKLLDDLVDEQTPVLAFDGDLNQPDGRSDVGDPVGECEPGSLVPEIDGEYPHGAF